VASVNERLFRLEAKAAPLHEVPPAMDRLLDAIEDARREIAGLPPLPSEARPYTAAEREDDIHFLEEVLPKYRTDEGWQSEEARAILDGWEEKTRAKLEGENQ
jgi:hypothetical protein